MEFLDGLKESHSKVKSLEYSTLQCQAYLTSPLFSNKDVNILFALRSRMVECKDNFKNRYKDADLLCPLCLKYDDTQQHMLDCKVLGERMDSKKVTNNKVVYTDIFEKNHLKQKEVTETFKELIELRDQIKEEIQLKQLDPCTLSMVLRNSDDLPNCIDNYSSGK